MFRGLNCRARRLPTLIVSEVFLIRFWFVFLVVPTFRYESKYDKG